MSTSIGNLPPPFPNAAQSLSKISGDAQLRARVEEASENKPIKTDVPVEVKSDEGSSTNDQAPRDGTGKTLDVSV